MTIVENINMKKWSGILGGVFVFFHHYFPFHSLFKNIQREKRKNKHCPSPKNKLYFYLYLLLVFFLKKECSMTLWMQWKSIVCPSSQPPNPTPTTQSTLLFSCPSPLISPAPTTPTKSCRTLGQSVWGIFFWWVNNEKHSVRVELKKGFEKRRGAGGRIWSYLKGEWAFLTNEASFLLLPFMPSYFYMLSFPEALSHAYASLNKSHKIKAKCIKITRHWCLSVKYNHTLIMEYRFAFFPKARHSLAPVEVSPSMNDLLLTVFSYMKAHWQVT